MFPELVCGFQCREDIEQESYREVSSKEPQGQSGGSFHSLFPLALQLAVEALEQEKQGLQSQIAQILEGGQQLAHLKMSLSLEVATYRYTVLTVLGFFCGPETWLCTFCDCQLSLCKTVLFMCICVCTTCVQVS